MDTVNNNPNVNVKNGGLDTWQGIPQSNAGTNPFTILMAVGILVCIVMAIALLAPAPEGDGKDRPRLFAERFFQGGNKVILITAIMSALVVVLLLHK
jgi:hypothetical protein